MKLLICTQKIDKDDPILGFFHRWVIEFAKNYESIIVICLEKGKYELPVNVRVLSLGKESRESRLKYIRNFYKYIWNERKNYDAVFVHMNQVYIILGGIFWRIWGKRIGLWYTHRATSFSLRLAVFLTHHIFTASKESFRIKTKKVHVVGHGIDLVVKRSGLQNKNTRLNIISLGRITRIKNLDILIDAMEILKNRQINFICQIIGPKITTDDNIYFEEIKEMVIQKDLSQYVMFGDAVSHEKIGDLFAESDININLAPTGGVDKVVLEGILSRAIPLVSNESFREIFGPFGDNLIFKERNAFDLVDKIEFISKIPNKEIIKESLSRKVEMDFGLPKIIKKITDSMLL